MSVTLPLSSVAQPPAVPKAPERVQPPATQVHPPAGAKAADAYRAPTAPPVVLNPSGAATARAMPAADHAAAKERLAAADAERRRVADRIKENGQVLGAVMDKLAAASATDDVASLKASQDTLKAQRADLYQQWGKLTDSMVRESGTIASLEAMHPSLKEPAPFVPGPNSIHF